MPVVAFEPYLAIGNALAVTQIDREWQTTQVQRNPNLGSTRSLESLPLFEEATVAIQPRDGDKDRLAGNRKMHRSLDVHDANCAYSKGAMRGQFEA